MTEMTSVGMDREVQTQTVLKEIAALHTYVLTGKKMRGKSGLSRRCTECGFAYPCSTIQIIEKALG
jgi:hypothetical protein